MHFCCYKRSPTHCPSIIHHYLKVLELNLTGSSMMGVFRRLAGMLGFPKDGESKNESENHDHEDDGDRINTGEVRGPRRGFSVPVQVPVDRTQQVEPFIVPCTHTEGEIQGLRWYAKRLRIDEDGDIGDEFLVEVLQETLPTGQNDERPFPRFEVKYRTRRAKVKKQVMSLRGQIQQCVEFHGQ